MALLPGQYLKLKKLRLCLQTSPLLLELSPALDALAKVVHAPSGPGPVGVAGGLLWLLEVLLLGLLVLLGLLEVLLLGLLVLLHLGLLLVGPDDSQGEVINRGLNVHVGLGRDLLVDVGLGGDLFVHVRRQGGRGGGKTEKNLSKSNQSNLFVSNKDESMRIVNEWETGSLSSPLFAS